MYSSSRWIYLGGLRLLVVVVVAGIVDSTPVQAHDDWAAPFMGGIMAGHVLTRFGEIQRQRNEELGEIVRGGYGGGYGGGGYGYERLAPRPAYAPPSMTPEQKLNELDTLAAGGYITPQEYKERRQGILNAL